MKDITGYEGLYAITEDGRVWSHPKVQYGKHKGKFLKPHHRGKYLTAGLYKERICKSTGLHRLVATVYIPNPNNFPIVRHLDNNPHNNHVSNLEWCTYETNIQQAYDDGLCPTTERQMEHSRKLGLSKGIPVIQLTKNGDIVNVFQSSREASRETGANQSCIWRCINGKGKSAKGFLWILG